MRVLVACEYSGRVRNAFAALEQVSLSLSCDFLDPEDGSSNHYKGDVMDIIDDGWDLMICHPPCTYLASSGLHWNTRGALVDGRPRAELTEEALTFIRTLLGANIPRIALENPIGCISTRIRKPDQTIQPWQFGEDASKATCLWLKNLPPLVPTNIVEPTYACGCGFRFEYALGKYGCPNCFATQTAKAVYGNQTPSGQNKLGPSEDRWKERSRTYQGIADAMAQQWSRAQ